MASTVLPNTSDRGKINITVEDIHFCSSFDSGNLDRVELCQVPLEYNLWIAPDCAGTSHENGNRTWFYFSVSVPCNYTSKIMRFNIQNMNRQSRLYQQRMTPFVRVVPGKPSWDRLRDSVEWQMSEEGLMLSFKFTIQETRRHTIYFAFCYPYSYTDCQRKLSHLDQEYGTRSKNLYYHRELLCYTLEGRRVDLLTISSLDGITEDREPRLAGLFPDTATPRAHHFTGKKVFMVSSRVHPGETPSSHVFNGLLDFLLREDDERAKAVRQHFVMKMIPMLNPDGVARGHYRTDTRGVNLNRVYLNPDPQWHPSVYAARSVMVHHHNKGVKEGAKSGSSDMVGMSSLDSRSVKDEGQRKRGGSANVALKSASFVCSYGSIKRTRSFTYPVDCMHVKSLLLNRQVCKTTGVCVSEPLPRNSENSTGIGSMSGIAVYVDLHAHATKRGCFLYGNFLKEEEQQVENMLYPRLVALNSPHLDFEHCVFSEKNMCSTDKRDGVSKEGSGRVALHKATGIIHSYTLECNYNSGRQCNAVSSATCDGGRASPPLPYSPMPHRYSITSYQQVGRALAVALLDLHGLNPWTRIPTCDSGSVPALRTTLALRIRTSRARARDNRSKSGGGTLYQLSSLKQSHPHSSQDKPRPAVDQSAHPPLPQNSSAYRKRAKIALDVSMLTELKRSQRHQVEVAKPHCRQRLIEKDREYELATMKNVAFPNSILQKKTDLDTADSRCTSAAQHHRKLAAKKVSQRLLPKRASSSRESHWHTPTYKAFGSSLQTTGKRTASFSNY